MQVPITRDGYVILFAPDGSEFRMPRGGDVRVYLVKGFATEPPMPAVAEPGAEPEKETQKPRRAK